MPIRWHQEDPALFREAVGFTAASTGFSTRLIEKDYFCSVVLEYLADDEALVFKGGTCLSKMHARFFRLSEDLDFSISTPIGANRRWRRDSIAGPKDRLSAIPREITGLRLVSGLTVEIGLREPVIEHVHTGEAATLILNPLTARPLVGPYRIQSLSHREAMAEKFRAAMCRRTVAIRDFFDIDHAVHTGDLDPFEPSLLCLVQRKLEAPGTSSPDVSPRRREELERQLNAELRPVLRREDFDQFDLDRAFEGVTRVVHSLR